MRKERKTYSLWQRFGAMALAAVLVLGMIPATGSAATNHIGTVNKVEDTETLNRPQAVYGDDTLNAGKITVDKSVSKDAVTVDGQYIPLTDDNNFLITISQTAQVMGLSSETSVPVDVVFVLDTSGSMNQNGVDRATGMVAAANSAIATLMETNDQNRVAVVAFSSDGYGEGTSGNAAASVLSSLAHYTGDAAANHLQWVNSQGTGESGSYIAGRDQATITIEGEYWWEEDETLTVNAFRNGHDGGTNIQAGIVAGAKILTAVQDKTWTDPDTNETVTRIPFLIILSDGQPTFSYDDETWYDPDMASDEQGPGSNAYEGNGFIAALTAAYYKGKITEHYYGDKADADNRCFVYTMGVEIEALDDYENNRGQTVSYVDDNQSLAQITLDPATYAVDGQDYYIYGNSWNGNNKSTDNGWKTYWTNYVAGTAFDVRIDNENPTSYTFTADSIADSKKYVNGIGYTGGLAYNDDYFAADDVADMEAIFEALIAEISKKAISVPTKVTTGDHDFDGYITFTDPLGEYMEVKDMKGIIVGDYFYKGANAARYMATGTNSAFNAILEKVLVTRMSMTDSTVTGAELLNSAKASANQAYYNSATDYDNSIVWWGSEFHTGEEDVQMQVVGAADNDTIAYIEAQRAAGNIPEGADYVCRSYFFYGEAGGANPNPNHEYLYFVVRVQRSLKAPYQQTVVISAPASLLSVEKVMVHERFDEDNNPVYTVSVEEAPPARVVYEVGLWETINEESVSTIVSGDYTGETVNGAGQVNYDPATDTYYFFTNDWDRSEDQAHHHRAMSKATFDAAADNGFYTYQQDTLILDANGNPVTSNPVGKTAYYERVYYDWSNATANADGTFTATRKTYLVQVEIPADASLIQDGGKWYIPKGAYTASTLVANHEDTEKSENRTDTAQIVAHPHRTGDSSNSHYTVLLGNNGSISLKSNVPAPTKSVSNVTRNIVDANGKSVMVGEELEYTIHAKNYSADAGTITITDTVPAGTVFVSADNGVTPDANGVLTWVLESVAAGAEVTVSFRVKVTEAALDNAVVTSAIQNTATVRLNNSPEYKTNTTTNPPQGKKVTIQGDSAGTSVQVGDVLQYAIEFHNDTGAVAEEITVVDILPEGTTFISADHNGVYDADAHTVTWTFTNVAAGAGGVVTFTVQVNASAVTPIANGATIAIGDNHYTTNTTNTTLDQGSLTLEKTVEIPTGLTPGADTFTLTLTEPTGKLNGTYSGVTFVGGVATLEIRHGETITIEGLAAGTTILVTEDVPAGFKASVTGNGQVVIPVGGTAAVEVTNTYAVSPLEVILQGSKTLSGGAPTPETFGFTVVPCDANGENPGAAVATGEVTLNKDSKDFTFGKLSFGKPGTYHYLVSEVNGGQTGVTYTQVQYLVTIEVTDNGDGTLRHTMSVKTRTGDSGAFTEHTGNLVFTNEYKPLSTVLELEGRKTLTGRDLKPGEFNFVVMEGDTVVSTGTNAADGTISFKPITYTAPGEHTYVISELSGNLQGVTYSGVTYTIKVTVVDDDGQLKATVTDAAGNTVELDQFNFTNTFQPQEVTVTLEASKVLTGATLTGGQFSFVVKDEDGNQVASGTNDANGKITFSTIEYFLADLDGQTSKTFRYTITELKPDSGVHPSMFYDGLEIGVTVTVEYDPTTGVLTVHDPVYTADTTFNNVDNPDNITVTPVGNKTTTNITGVRFSFSVYNLDENAPGMLGANISSGVSDANGAITFSGITYDYDDLGNETTKEFRYWIVEDRGGSTHAGVAYDATRYLMVVTLTKNATNKLEATVAYYGLDPAVAPENATVADYNVTKPAAAFVNSYSVTSGTAAIMQVSKALANRDLKDGEFEFGLYHIEGGKETLVLTATNDAGGLVTFTREYAANILAQGQLTREIHYVIRELDNKVAGVDYSDALANPVYVKVVVTDLRDGTMETAVTYYADAAMENEIAAPVFDNTFAPGDLTVYLEGTKRLTGATLKDGRFSFVVYDAGGKEVAWATNAADGTIAFSGIRVTYQQFLAADTDQDGAATFRFTVRELKPVTGADPNLYYDPAVFEVDVTVRYDRASGELSYDEPLVVGASALVFRNVQNPATVEVQPAGTKTIINHTESDVSGLRFSFRVTALTGDDLSSMTLGTVEATGISTGSAIHFTSLTFDNAAVGKTFYYIIDEIPADQVNTVTYSTAKYGMSVYVYRDPANYNKLAATVTYYNIAQADDINKPANWKAFQAGDAVDFVNEFEGAYATLNIRGTKNMVGKTLTGGAFDFRLQLLDENGVPVPGMIVDGVNDADGTIHFGTLIFTEKQMDAANPAQVYEYRVAITEIKPETNAIPGVTYSTQAYIAVIRWEVTMDENNQLIYGQPVVEEVLAAEKQGDKFVVTDNSNLLDAETSVEEALKFTNKYQVTSGTNVELTVDKFVENRLLGDLKFEFGLYHVDKTTGKETLIMTVVNGPDGKVTFSRDYDPSVLTQYGDGRKATLEYVIRELNNNIPGVTYATNGVRVTVVLEDNGDGTMKAPVITYVDTPSFTNIFTPANTAVKLEATKKLTGATLKAGAYSFVVYDDAGNPVAWAKNDENGVIRFSTIEYTYGQYLARAENGVATFTYTVKEVAPNVAPDPNLYYDPTVFTVTVTVTYDESTGILTAVAGDTTGVVFHNYLNPATVTATPAANKTLVNKKNQSLPMADGQFSFSVLDMAGNVVAAGTSKADGTVDFSTIIYDIGDLGTHKYWIVEDNGGNTTAGITHDNARYLMVVNVYQDGAEHNVLKTSVEYFALAEGADPTLADSYTAAITDITFRNVYRVTDSATAEMVANKTLTGRVLRNGEFSFNLYHLHEGSKVLVASTSNGHDGDIGRIFFSRTYAPSILDEHGDGKKATIYYVMEEQRNGLGGVDYSNAVPVYVKVELEDLDNGTMDVRVTYYSDDAFTQEITETPVFANSYTTQDVGYTPKVCKILSGRDMGDNEFSFVITDLAGNPVVFGLSKAADSDAPGAITFGEITYTYRQYVTAPKNAAGDAVFTYIISEVPGNLVNVTYTTDKIYLQVTVHDDGSGNLSATGAYFSDETCQTPITGDPTFRNTYTAMGTTVNLQADKALTGRPAVNGEFSFQVTDRDGNVVSTGGNQAGAVVFSGIGITAEMMEGSLTKDFIFTMEELNSNQGAVTFDTSKYYAKVTVTNNLAAGMLEVTAVTYYSDPECQDPIAGAPVFANAYNPTAVELALPIHKDLINHTLEAGMFHFEVRCEGQVVAQISNDANGNTAFQVSYPVSVLDGVEANADNVRTKTFVYTVTEVSGTADSADDNGTYTYDGTVYTVTVTVTDDGKGNLSAAVEIKKDGEAAEHVVFTNRFTPDPITVDLDTAIGATKTIVDDEGNVLFRDDVVFTFEVRDLAGQIVATGTAKGADAADGVMPIDFGTFTFAAEGEYRYLITESTATLDGYVLDTTVWCAHIQVRYDPDTGKLSVGDDDVFTHIFSAESHAEDGIQALVSEAPDFVNVYDADDVQLHLTLDKKMTGDRTAAREHEFTFQLLNADGTIAGEARNHADGTVSFYLDYTLQDLNGQPSRTFTYTVKEIIPADAVEQADGTYVRNGITYDTKTYTLTVTLSDNGKGALVTTLNGTVVTGTVDTGIDFVNRYEAQDVIVPFHAIKRMEGMPLFDGIYTFYLMDGDTIVATGTNKADGTIVFDKTLTYTEPGTYTYTMVEYKDTKPGVTFDETSFAVTVEVTDNGLGQLEAEVTYTTAEGIFDQPVFINIYQPAGITAVIKAHKDLTGRALKSEFTFRLLDADRNVVSEVTNDADGGITFDTQHYNEVGTYTYTMEEVIPAEAVENTDGTYTLNGVTYDKTVYTVVVEITDVGYDGQLDKQVTYYLGTEVVEEAAVIFTNVYSAAAATTDVQARKELTGKPLADGEFTFLLVNKDNENERYTATNKADGSIVFADLSFSVAGTYVYELREVQGTDTVHYTYDDTVITVTITVVDNGDGTMTATPSYSQTAVFRNTYTPDPIVVTLTGHKDLTGRDLKADEFDFEVRDGDGLLVTTGTNKADGTIVFHDIVIDTEMELTLYVTEVKGTEKKMVYDDYTYRVKIVVTNVSGVLEAKVEYLDGDIVFYNEYKPSVNPDTGDDTPIYFYMGLMTFSALALMAVVVLGGRKKQRMFF